MLGSKFVKFLMSVLNWQVSSFSNFASFFIVMTHNSLINFKVTHFLLWIKVSHQSPNFETSEYLLNSSCHFWKHMSVFLQIMHQYSVPSKITPLYVFSSNIIYFGQKQPIKCKIFEIFECSSQNSSNSSCQFWNNKSVPLQIFYHSSVSLHMTPL